MIRILFCLLILMTPAWAVTNPDEKLADPALEARAVSLSRELRCVVCQNESIEESRADMAHDLRVFVRQQIRDGRTDDEIRRALKNRYGDFIFLKPPLTARTIVLWLMPVIAMIVGGLMFLVSQHGRRRRIRR